VIEPRLFVCSGAEIRGKTSLAKGRKCVVLNSIGPPANVNIRFENLARVFARNPSPRLIDFLEIAAYVFSADCITSRGDEWQEESIEPWNRDFSFLIAVRDLEFWSNASIATQLKELLSFISGDKYTFTFVPLNSDARGLQEYIEFGEAKKWPFHKPERVVMFSGGLDSLAGAVESARKENPLLLVSHRSASTLDSRQQKLFGELDQIFPGKLIHLPVWVNKVGELRRESTQRTRSFLFTAVGTIAAELVQAGGVRFYENGVVSLNLPMAGEALRTRASRTTHPITLQLLQEFCSKVLDRSFIIDNPYLFKTKTDVIETMASHRAVRLIACTCSCSHLIFSKKDQRHCGTCSQCIDRRFAIMAAGLEKYDSDTDYASDVFLGPRKEGYERNMAIDYTRHALELDRRSDSDLAAIFSTEISRAVRFDQKKSEAAQHLINLHKRHGQTVAKVLRELIRSNAELLAKGGIAELLAKGGINKDCLLALVLGANLNSPPVKMDNQPGVETQQPTLSSIATKLDDLLKKFNNPLNKQISGPRQKKLTKSDTVMLAAIKMGYQRLRYCSFLHNHGIVPRWKSSEHTSYGEAYKEGQPWRKKIQDEKSRAKVRMKDCSEAEFAVALNKYLPKEFQQISERINSHNSQFASKNSPMPSRVNTDSSAI
jgi:hypothetical protein